jgi:Ion channel
MLSKLLIAWCLMAICVTIHAIGLTAAFRVMMRYAPPVAARFWPATWMLVFTAGWIIMLHLLQITVWAFFYTCDHGMPDLQSAFYFSAVTYTTTGYGDVVLPAEWRVIGGVEALTGILMCGLSTGFFFAVFARVFGISGESKPTDRNK